MRDLMTGIWRKPLSAALDNNSLERVMNLNRFGVARDGVMFRAVHYLEVTHTQLTMEAFHGQAASGTITSSGRTVLTSRMKRRAANVARLAGCWLAHFHQWPSDGIVEPYDLQRRAEQTLSRLECLIEHGLSPRIAKRLLRRIEETSAEKPVGTVATIHGDFKPDNVMLAAREVAGVDMEGYHRGHPLVDLGQWLAHVFLARSGGIFGTGPPLWWRRLNQHFLAGYEGAGGVEPQGLEFRVWDAMLALLADMAHRRGRCFWSLRGRNLMTRTLEDLLENPIAKVWGHDAERD